MSYDSSQEEKSSFLNQFFNYAEDQIAKFSVSPLTAWMNVATDEITPDSWLKSAKYYGLLFSLLFALPTTVVIAKTAMFVLDTGKSIVNSFIPTPETATRLEVTEANETFVAKKSSTAQIHSVVGYSNTPVLADEKDPLEKPKLQYETKVTELEPDVEPKASYGFRR